MRIACFAAKDYDSKYLDEANAAKDFEITYFEARLTNQTASLAIGFDAVCIFVNDVANRSVLQQLARQDIHLVLLRCTGFNNVDLVAAAELKITVLRVPAYSPFAASEHTVGMMLCLNRRLHKAYARVREGNFSLDGLLGFDMHSKTVGIIGTGKVGSLVAKSLKLGFGCNVVAYDVTQSEEVKCMGISYVSLDTLISTCDIISLHIPLLPNTQHLINADSIAKMKQGAMLINTSRGALVDTAAVIQALKSHKLGAVGLDVYEEEADIFYEDLSNKIIQDDALARLLSFPNVLVTAHQAFFTATALEQIARTTLQNAGDYFNGAVKPANKVQSQVSLTTSVAE